MHTASSFRCGVQALVERIAQETVARWMKAHGLRSRTVSKHKATTASQHTYPVHKNVLDQRFVTEQPGQVYMADITYIPTDEGWLYLASVGDLYTRKKIVGWHADVRMTKELCLDALDQAYHDDGAEKDLELCSCSKFVD